MNALNRNRAQRTPMATVAAILFIAMALAVAYLERVS